MNGVALILWPFTEITSKTLFAWIRRSKWTFMLISRSVWLWPLLFRLEWFIEPKNSPISIERFITNFSWSEWLLLKFLSIFLAFLIFQFSLSIIFIFQMGPRFGEQMANSSIQSTLFGWICQDGAWLGNNFAISISMVNLNICSFAWDPFIQGIIGVWFYSTCGSEGSLVRELLFSGKLILSLNTSRILIGVTNWDIGRGCDEIFIGFSWPAGTTINLSRLSLDSSIFTKKFLSGKVKVSIRPCACRRLTEQSKTRAVLLSKGIVINLLL